MSRAFLLALFLAGTAHAAGPRVLATSGVKVDGLGIASLEAPGVAATGAIFFRGASTTLTIAGVTFATGEPLPPPFTGTIDEVLDGQVAGGLSAVLTSAGGPDLSGAIFAIDGGVVTPLVTVAPADPSELQSFVMNSRGDVVYVARSTMGSELYTRARSSGITLRVAGPDNSLRKLKALVIDESGAAAWMDRHGAVSYWDATHGTQVVISDRFPTKRGRRSPIALHETFGLLFVTRNVFGKFSPADGTVSIIANLHGTVGGINVRRLYGDTGFNEDGTAVALVRSKKRPYTRYVCLPPTGQPIECDGSLARSGAGTPLHAERASAIFRANHNGVSAIVRPGTVLGDSGTLAHVTDHVVAGRTVAFLGVLDDGRDVLGWWRDGQVQASVADGDRVGGRTLDLASPLHDAGESTALVEGYLTGVDGGSVADATSLVLVRRGGRATVLRTPRKTRFSDFTVLEALIAGRRLLVLTYDALFTAQGRRLVPLLVPGGDDPQALQSISDIAAAGTRAVVAGARGGVYSLFELERDGLRRFADLPSSFFLFGIDATTVAVQVELSRGGGATFVDELQLVGRNGAARTVAALGDPSPVGAIASMDAVALAGADVVISARVSGDGARHALLAVDR